MPAGRPPFFSSPEELEQKIQEYFEYCEGRAIPPEGPEDEPTVTKGHPVTITGLALWLGFESRQSFYDYEKHEQYSYIIKKARLTVECEYEKSLQGKNPTGSIFALKNMGWTDKHEIDQNTRHSGEINHTIDHSKLSDAALREIAALDQPKESKD